MNSKTKINLNTNTILIFSIIFIGFLVRIIGIGSFPRGLSQDEAFGAYDAYSKLYYGTDSLGYVNPVYFGSWGSGMSVLYSILIMPLIKLFGVTSFAIRLPEALIGSISLIVLYLLMKKISNDRLAIITLFIFAINPWHILMVRWGLDSALAPAFILFGMYFFILGLEKEKYFIASAVFYGLSLYCYALLWPVVPVMLAFQVLYGLWYKKIHLSKLTIISVFVLFIIALPLMLFVLVNYDLIPEIKTSIISIPKIPYFRSSELSNGTFIEKLYRLYCIVIKQNDGLICNVIPQFGSYYQFSLVFIVIGGFTALAYTLKCFREKRLNPLIFILFQLFITCVLALILEKCEINKINILHIPIIVLCSIGIYKISSLVSKKLVILLFALYTVCFMAFEYHYFTDYQEQIAVEFNDGAVEAVEFAMQLENNTDKICVTETIYHPQILLAAKFPTTEYLNSVIYTNYPAKWLDVESFGRFIRADSFEEIKALSDKYSLNDNTIFIWDIKDSALFTAKGYSVEEFENFIVAYK